MTINSPGGDAARVLPRASARSRACPRAELRGTIQTDILKEYIAQKEWIFPPEPSMRLVTDMVEFCAARDAAVAPDLDLRLPHPRGRLDRRAGARVHARRRLRVRRVGASSAASTSTTSRRGCRSSSTRTSTSSRRSRSSAPRGASGRASCASATARRTRARWLMRFHTQTAGVSLTAQQPRGQHRAHGARGARGRARRHAVAAHELVRRGARAADRGGRADRAAHAAGDRARDRRRRTRSTRSAARTTSRTLTNRLEAEAYELLRPDRRSSAAWSPAIKENFFQREIAEASFRYQREVEARPAGHRRRQPLRARGRAADPELLKIDPALEREQIERVQALRARRDAAAVEARSRALTEAAAREDVNLMPLIVDAARAYVTMGEMCDALREVWGVWRETPVF